MLTLVELEVDDLYGPFQCNHSMILLGELPGEVHHGPAGDGGTSETTDIFA